MRITIITEDPTDERESGDATMSLSSASLKVEHRPGEALHPEQIVLTLAQFFQHTAEKFLATHPCKDCSTYRLINSMHRHMTKAEHDVLKDIEGSDEMLKKLDDANERG